MANVLSPLHLPSQAALVAITTRVKDRLIVQPRPDALGVAQVALLPLLLACGHEVFDVDVLRGSVDARRVVYRLRLDEDAVTIQILGVGEPLPRGLGDDEVAAGSWKVRSNGGDWQLLLPGESPYVWSLYDDAFPRLVETLFRAGGVDIGRRGFAARALLQQQWLSDKLARLSGKLGREELRTLLGVPPVAPERVVTLLHDHRLLRETHAVDPDALRLAVAETLFASDAAQAGVTASRTEIGLEDVLRYCGPVSQLRGRLEARFDGQELPITSRAAYYYVLASLALQVGREDAIPAEDLIRPPARVPVGLRSRPLERSGWQLLMTRDKDALEHATSALLDRLMLRRRLVATQRGRAWPS